MDGNALLEGLLTFWIVRVSHRNDWFATGYRRVSRGILFCETHWSQKRNANFTTTGTKVIHTMQTKGLFNQNVIKMNVSTLYVSFKYKSRPNQIEYTHHPPRHITSAL